MAIDILMPALSPTMESGKLARWCKQPGEKVSAGDIIAEIETDKATMEVEAVDEGIMAVHLVDEGTDGVAVNSVIARLAEDGEDIEVIASSASPKQDNAVSGDQTKDDNMSAHALETLEVSAEPAHVVPHQTGQTSKRRKASPLARRLAALHNLELVNIEGSGPGGRIVKRDIDKALAQPKSPVSQATQSPAPVTTTQAGEATKIPLDGMRKTIAARLSEAKREIPHFYLTLDCQLDDLLTARKALNSRMDDAKISVNDFIIKALGLALRDVPEANAQWAGDHIVRLHTSDVAVAVAIEGGLFTPVLRDVQTKGLKEISSEMKYLADLARKRRLTPDQYTGGSTSISNLGMFGIKNFQAVINPPHASILAVGAGEERVVSRGGQITSANMMSVTLSCDHRVVDGALGAELLQAFKHYIENPVALAL